MKRKPKLFYKGKDGGCQVVWKTEKEGSKIKAYLCSGHEFINPTPQFFPVAEERFKARTEEYKPVWEIRKQDIAFLEIFRTTIQKIW